MLSDHDKAENHAYVWEVTSSQTLPKPMHLSGGCTVDSLACANAKTILRYADIQVIKKLSWMM